MTLRFRFIDKPRLKAQFQFEPRDCWIGLFWQRTEVAFHLYVCLIPLVPLHVTIALPAKGKHFDV